MACLINNLGLGPGGVCHHEAQEGQRAARRFARTHLASRSCLERSLGEGVRVVAVDASGARRGAWARGAGAGVGGGQAADPPSLSLLAPRTGVALCGRFLSGALGGRGVTSPLSAWWSAARRGRGSDRRLRCWARGASTFSGLGGRGCSPSRRLCAARGLPGIDASHQVAGHDCEVADRCLRGVAGGCTPQSAS